MFIKHVVILQVVPTKIYNFFKHVVSVNNNLFSQVQVVFFLINGNHYLTDIKFPEMKKSYLKMFVEKVCCL